ncbi:MAG TPA: 50S ribosomal protein L21 [Candidatus Saccharimonadales bacterium]|nr:50S ribosomal protein L21 [Candidatus Saccharimonadales bacterium]
MKKAVISTGGKQYLVAKGDELDVDLLNTDKKTITFDPLLVFDEKGVKIGTPIVESAKVTAKIINLDKQSDKVTSIRYKSKKRVHKIRGHRQRHATIKIDEVK